MARLTLGWIQLAEIVGALQGLILAAVLAAQSSNRTANRLLATLMAAMSVYLAAGPYYATDLIRAYPHFFAVNYQTTWVFGPLVYLYARAASDRAWRLTPGSLVHFVPVAITTLAAMPIYMMSGTEKITTFEHWSAHGIDGPLRWLDPFKYVSGIAYTAATAVYLVRHRRDVEHSYSNIERVNLRWLLWICAGTGSIWVLVTTLRIAQVSAHVRDAPVGLAMALLVYGIGYMGLRQPEIFRHAPFATRIETRIDDPTPFSVHDRPVSRYEHSGLGDVEALRLRESLLGIMEAGQPWKESELTLPDLAERVGTTPHKLSELLNGQLGETFYDFVNGYRVRDVQRRIQAGHAQSFKMLALAMDAGFASKSTFNEVFRKHTGQTPSQFRSAVSTAARLA